MANLKQTINEIAIAGLLVKNNLEKVRSKDNRQDVIRGSLTVRTLDESEVEVHYYANEFKKDKENDGALGDKNGMFDSLLTVLQEYKDVEKHTIDGADIVRVTRSSFDVNDFKGNDGVIKTGTRIKANFANRIKSEELENTPLVATFQVEGVITRVEDEIKKEEATGNVRVDLHIIGYQGTLIPITLTAPANYAEYIKENYHEGEVATLWGKIVNTKEVVVKTEEGGFGESFSKTFTTYVKKYEITGGNPARSMEEAGIEEEEYTQARAKRRLKLDNLLKEEKQNSAPTTGGFGTNGNGAMGAGAPMGNNPFGGGASAFGGGSNPFSK